jgi:outer membrane protein assembly factor BamB
MATYGRRVFALFANGDLAAFTLEGKPAWSKSFGALKNAYGHATSLVTWKDRLIVQLDQGEPEENKSKLYLLDGRTGSVVWQKPRKAGASWATPLAFEVGGKGQVVASAVPLAVSYSMTDGTELWKADCLNGEVTPTAIFAGGFVIVPSPSEKFSAIRPDGEGDVSKSKVAWTMEENVPDVTSPCSDGELLFAVTTGGMLSCLEVATGKKVWEHDLENEFHASPVLAGRKVYLFSQKGTAVVVEAAREYKQLQRVEMPDAFHATPAIAQDHIVVRGMTNVWCFGAIGAEQKAASQ